MQDGVVVVVVQGLGIPGGRLVRFSFGQTGGVWEAVREMQMQQCARYNTAI